MSIAFAPNRYRKPLESKKRDAVTTEYIKKIKVVPICSLMSYFFFVSWAHGQVSLTTKIFQYESKTYTLVIIDTSPSVHGFGEAQSGAQDPNFQPFDAMNPSEVWDFENPLSEGFQIDPYEFQSWVVAEHIIRGTQEFLRSLYDQQFQNTEGRDPLENYIMSSFTTAPWLGLGESIGANPLMHKADDYFSYPSLIATLYEGSDFGADSILGTVKFVRSRLARLSRPKLLDFEGLISNPLELLPDSSDHISIEYENLARRSDSPLNPIPLLLIESVEHSFFRSLSEEDPDFSVHLNATLELVPHHEKYGFSIDSSFYSNFDRAVRMSGNGMQFVQTVLEKERLREADSQNFFGRSSFVEVNWEEALKIFTEEKSCDQSFIGL